MRAWMLAVGAVAGAAGPAAAQDGQRFVERAPLPVFPINPDYSSRTIGPRTQPAVTPQYSAGYVGGGSVFGGGGGRLLGRLFHRGGAAAPAYSVPGPGAVPTTVGAFATDYTGMALSARQVFLRPPADPSAAAPLVRSYRTDGRYPADVFALRPFRKAVIEQKEDAEKRRHGEEGHGGEGHGAEPPGEAHVGGGHGGK
jgi:hypothetical protein